MRGDLEPKALQARSLAEERERLASELAAVKAEATRTATESAESHAREVAGLTEQHASAVASAAQRHATELERVTTEHDEKAAALDQSTRNAELREQYWENTVNGLREAQKKLQREAAEAEGADAPRLESRSRRRCRSGLNARREASAQLDRRRAARNQQRAEAAETESRRNALDRQRFAAYLEEGPRAASWRSIPPAARRRSRSRRAAEAAGEALALALCERACCWHCARLRMLLEHVTRELLRLSGPDAELRHQGPAEVC